MSEALDVTDLQPGTVLMGKYRVVRTLGIGGMGVVVAADHLALDNRVAIKFLLPQLVSNDQVVQRFVLEAKASTRISSDHVARVIDVGTMSAQGLPPGGVPFMVMEYLEGKDLSEWIRMGKKFPIDEAIDYIVQAGEALAQAHRVGIIHRDIKPANLFLTEREDRKEIKVLDFGISKLLEADTQSLGLTKTTTVLGSGLYMSPEQMRSAKNVDFRTDIYSLGVCLYELLSGTQPHTAESFSELCVKVNIDPPTPLRDYRPDVQESLAEAIAKAYARLPDERYQTVQDFVISMAPFASPPSVPTINQIQGITRFESMTPPPLTDPRLAATAAAVTATTDTVDKKPRSTVGVALSIAIAAVVLAGGAGVFMMQMGDGGSNPATSEPSAIVTADPPPMTSSAVAAPSTTSAVEAPDAGDVAAATDAATSAPKPPPTRVPRPPRKVPTAKPPPPPPKCGHLGPDGLMVPCP